MKVKFHAYNFMGLNKKRTLALVLNIMTKHRSNLYYLSFMPKLRLDSYKVYKKPDLRRYVA